MRRLVPAVLLTVLSPIVAEFLLGDFSIRNLSVLVALLPLYGCGALLIREIARRTGRGWPTVVLLGAAFALLEEGFLTQSLFNPNYVGQRLLDYGYMPALGTSLNWSLFVLSIHVVWSIATPILIAEGLAADRWTQSWLKTPGLAITSLLFIAGCAMTTAFSLKSSPFVATPQQFAAVGVLVLLAIVGAFTIRSKGASARQTAPRPFWVFLAAAATSILFMLAEPVARDRALASWVPLGIRATCEMVAVVSILRWSRMRAWGPRHYLALAAGTTLTYALFGLFAFLQGHTNLGAPTDRVDVAGQIALASAVFLLIGSANRRSRLIASPDPDTFV